MSTELSAFSAEVACLPRPQPLTTWIPSSAAVSSKCAARCSNVSDVVAGTAERATHSPEIETLESPALVPQIRGYVDARTSGSPCLQLTPPHAASVGGVTLVDSIHPPHDEDPFAWLGTAAEMYARLNFGAVALIKRTRYAGALERTDSPVGETIVEVRPILPDETPSVHPLSLVESSVPPKVSLVEEPSS